MPLPQGRRDGNLFWIDGAFPLKQMLRKGQQLPGKLSSLNVTPLPRHHEGHDEAFPNMMRLASGHCMRNSCTSQRDALIHSQRGLAHIATRFIAEDTELSQRSGITMQRCVPPSWSICESTLAETNQKLRTNTTCWKTCLGSRSRTKAKAPTKELNTRVLQNTISHETTNHTCPSFNIHNRKGIQTPSGWRLQGDWQRADRLVLAD